MKIIEKSEKMDIRLKKLSETIVNHSVKIKKNDRVLIQYQPQAKPLVKELIQAIKEKEGIPFIKITDPEINALILENAKENRIKEQVIRSKFEVDNYDVFITITYTTNDYETLNVSKEYKKKQGIALTEINDTRINKRRWIILNYPSNLDAYKAKMTTEDYYNYAIDVMNYDYEKMEKDIKPLKELMEKTDNVRIVGPGTDISFSIKGMKAIPCCGTANIPDGECYTAPIKDSVNGKITYNTPSPYQGNTFENISLTFENGKIIKAESEQNQEKLNEIFDSDEGARYIGEFSFGFNPLIKEPMGDILFDEKIMGSIHFTPGQAYADADNGNKSIIHWDLVLIQRPEYGGGEVYFDHTLIRKDGKFVLDSLKQLNGKN